METRVKYETANRYDEYLQLYITECIEAMYIKYRKEVDNIGLLLHHLNST